MSERFKYVISVVVFSMILIMTEFIMMNMIGRWKRMNDEVENYDNEEFIAILTALGSNTKILINGSTDFEIRHSWNNGEPYINIVTKEKDR